MTPRIDKRKEISPVLKMNPVFRQTGVMYNQFPTFLEKFNI